MVATTISFSRYDHQHPLPQRRLLIRYRQRGICCGYDTSRPAPGEEYKIEVCRSTQRNGGFVGISLHYVRNICLPMLCRSIKLALRALRHKARLSLRRTIMYTAQVGKVCIMILSMAGSYTITTSTRTLAMQMDRSNLDGIRSTGGADGRLCNRSTRISATLSFKRRFESKLSISALRTLRSGYAQILTCRACISIIFARFEYSLFVQGISEIQISLPKQPLNLRIFSAKDFLSLAPHTCARVQPAHRLIVTEDD
jgi:hypothetical protein